jgi:hypothetical protein
MMPAALQPAPPTLELRTLAHPARPHLRVPVFGDWLKACEHLRDHLLTAPECYAWADVLPEYADILDPASEDARWRYAQEAMATGGRRAQALYDLYSAATARDARDAALLAWHCTEGDVTVALGTSGILLVVEDVVRTAFLPGQGSPLQTQLARDLPEDSAGLPRQAGMRTPRPARPALAGSTKEQRERREREALWSREQRLYYHVFKPSVQFVRECHHRHRDMHGKLLRRDYALLKEVLPPLSRLKFHHWMELRERCRRGEGAAS